MIDSIEKYFSPVCFPNIFTIDVYDKYLWECRKYDLIPLYHNHGIKLVQTISSKTWHAVQFPLIAETFEEVMGLNRGAELENCITLYLLWFSDLNQK